MKERVALHLLLRTELILSAAAGAQNRFRRGGSTAKCQNAFDLDQDPG
jgi:hypothetical protein